MTQQDPARVVMDTVTGTWRTQALYAAVAMRLPDHVAEGHTTNTALARQADADPDGIDRLMRLLIAIDVFGEDGGGYRSTPVSDLLRSDKPGSMRDMCLMYGEEFHRAWGAIVPCIRTGQSGFEHAFGRSLHDYLANEDGAGAKFLRAMNAGSPFFADLPDVYDFSSVRTVTDIAGGSGILLSAILRAYPHVHGVMVDKEHMIPSAKQHLSSAVDGSRFDVVCGDFFESVPAGSDVYLLSRVLQDWDDDECVRLLANVRQAMKHESTRLLVVERVITDDGSQLFPLLFDLHLRMMAGGRERDLPGYESLFESAGLRLEATHELAVETSLLVAKPV